MSYANLFVLLLASVLLFMIMSASRNAYGVTNGGSLASSLAL